MPLLSPVRKAVCQARILALPCLAGNEPTPASLTVGHGAIAFPMACKRLLSASVVSWVSSQIMMPPRFSTAYSVFWAIVSGPL